MYSRNDVKQAIAEGHLKIIPYEEKNLTGMGYNLSTTNFAFSIKQGTLLKIYEITNEQGAIHYVNIPANDTVLFFSKEFLETDNTIAGIFVSKVSRVCQGLGHICTTLDPKWKGQLIISVNNPTNKSIRFDLDKDSGNIFTLLLFGLNQEVTGDNIHDNNQGRCDLLISQFMSEKVKIWRKRYLELKEFVIGDFANSLNGYDNFIFEDENVNRTVADKYTQKVRHLLELKHKLSKEEILLKEHRYLLGESGYYELIHSPEQKELTCGCTLFNLMNLKENEILKKYPENEIISSPEEVIDMMHKILRVIDYELETVNHSRRIEWQNKEIEHYTEKNSQILQYKKWAEVGRNIIMLLGSYGLLSYIYSRLIEGGMSSGELGKVIFSVSLTAILGSFIHLIEKKRDKD